MLAVSLTACTTPAQMPLTETSPVQPQATARAVVPYRSLALADAVSLVNEDAVGFNSAARLAARRPYVKREINGLTLSHAVKDSEEKLSEMRFSPLPLGLDYTLHQVPASSTETALTEGIIGIFGATDALYWNSRFPYPNGMVNTAPDQLRLVSGHLFEPGSKFVLENNSGHGARSIDCTPISSAAAITVHASLTGKVTTFGCKAGDGVSQLLWYFEDYARYLSAEVKVDDEIQSRFKVISVSFAEPCGVRQ